MIPKVRRGRQMTRLMAYLAGPGKANEHTDPHIVAGSSWIMSWYMEQRLTVSDARKIGRDLESPTAVFNVQVAGGHVWHCSLAIEAEAGRLSDDRWAQIAEQFMTRMGFVSDDPDEPSLRWVAVRHGLSAGGNDHIHLAVNLVHEDGSIANVFRDWKRAQQTCRQLETEHGLCRLGVGGRSMAGYEPGEIEAEGRRRAHAKHDRRYAAGRTAKRWHELTPGQRRELTIAQRPEEAVRFTLARKVRACAVSSADEAEFVRRVRGQGMLIRPRFARGTQDVIEGYRVAARPQFGERPIWFGGGRLGKDLSLPRLREEWPDTPLTATAATAEWRAAWRGVRVAKPGRETVERVQPPPQTRERIGQDIELLAQRLRFARNADPVLWARTAHQVSGALAAWSAGTEPTPGPLAAAADAIARSAELQRHAQPANPGGTLTVDNSALLFALVGKTGKARDRIVQAMLLRQMIALCASIGRMHEALSDVQRAEHINRVLTQQLTPLAGQLDVGGRREPEYPRAPEPTPQIAAAVIAAWAPMPGSALPPKPTRPPAAARPRTPLIVRQPERSR